MAGKLLDETGLAELWSLTKNLPNHYVWEKLAPDYTDTTTSYTSNTVFLRQDTITAYYASSYTMANGAFVLTNPSSVAPQLTASNMAAVKGKYVIGGSPSGAEMWFIAANANVSAPGNGYIYATACTKHTLQVDYELAGYVNSADKNAYPVNDGNTYVPLGQLGKKAQIATGSYTGTGTYNSANPSSLTFDFVPKFVLIFCTTVSQSSNGALFVPEILTTSYQERAYQSGIFAGAAPASRNNSACFDGKTLYWYSTTDYNHQQNVSGKAYKYYAIG